MDADRRHELKQNALAASLLRLWEQLDRYSTPLAIALAAVAVTVGGYRLWTWNSALKIEQGWAQLMDVGPASETDDQGNIDSLREIGRRNLHPTLDAAVHLRVASELTRGVEGRSAERIFEAVRELEEVTSAAGAPAPIRAAAEFRLATLFETLGKFEDAQQRYRNLTENPEYAGSPFQDLANERLTSLDAIRRPVEMLAGLPPTASQPDAAIDPNAGELEIIDLPIAAPTSQPGGTP